MHYCESALSHPLHAAYHAEAYGFPVADEASLLERLTLEINQAGLSWLLMLQKQANFRAAFADFAVDAVAQFTAADVERLLGDRGIVRNRRKIMAVIENARRIVALRPEFGGLAGWLEAQHPLELPEWQRRFKRTFVFTGPEVVREFLQSTGYLPGAHQPNCPVYPRILAANPPWVRAGLAEPSPAMQQTEAPDASQEVA